MSHFKETQQEVLIETCNNFRETQQEVLIETHDTLKNSTGSTYWDSWQLKENQQVVLIETFDTESHVTRSILAHPIQTDFVNDSLEITTYSYHLFKNREADNLNESLYFYLIHICAY